MRFSVVTGLAALVFLIIGIIFKLQHWPGADVNIYMGCIYFLFALVSFFIAPKQQKQRKPQDVLDCE